MLARYEPRRSDPPDHEREMLWNDPRNAEQAFALNVLMDDEIKLVALTGKSGTGRLVGTQHANMKLTNKFIGTADNCFG